jgi:hypothetical protein
MHETQILRNNSGNNIVVIPNIIFTNKQNINWEKIETYLEQYVGSIIVIENTRDTIYIGKNFPDEYTGSKYTRTLKGARAKAKANAVQCLPELLKIASDKIFSINKKQKHTSDAGNGWYYYTTRFALPVYENSVKTGEYNIYKGCLVINHASNGKMYLYDLVDIKKEASNPLKTNQ